MFSRSNLSLALLLMSSDVAFYQKSNTADAKLKSAIISRMDDVNSTQQGKSTVS
jgi:hypothetical protein